MSASTAIAIDKSSRIAFLGLGAMGSRMATRLIEAGFSVTVYSRNPRSGEPLRALGATVTDTPRQAAAGARVVFAMVTDDDASRAVWLDAERGAMGALDEGAIAIDASTLTPACARELAAGAQRRGAHFLGAPVAGSRPQAEAGRLIFFVGGDAAILDRARPVLEPLSTAIHHAGECGHGMAMKLAVNSYFAVQVAALSEAIGLAMKSGLDRHTAAEILKGLPITGPGLAGVAAQIQSKSYDALFPIDLVSKDLRYVQSAASSVGGEAPLSQTALEIYERTRQAGYGDENISAVARLWT